MQLTYFPILIKLHFALSQTQNYKKMQGLRLRSVTKTVFQKHKWREEKLIAEITAESAVRESYGTPDTLHFRYRYV